MHFLGESRVKRYILDFPDNDLLYISMLEFVQALCEMGG